MLPVLEKWLGIIGSVVGVVSGVLVSVQATLWPGGPPHWVAVVGTVLGVVGMVVAKLLEFFSGTVQLSKGNALLAKAATVPLKPVGS